MNFYEKFPARRRLVITGAATEQYEDGDKNCDIHISVVEKDDKGVDMVIATGVVSCFSTDVLDCDDDGTITTHKLSGDGTWLVPKSGTTSKDRTGYGFKK